MPVLVDLEPMPECMCTEHLELMAKAMAEGGAAPEDSIWALHENEFLTAHVEDVTRQLQAIAERIQDAMARALLGEPIGELAKAEGPAPWLRWDEQKFEETRAYLEGKDPATYTLEDWLLLSEFIVNRYCPTGTIANVAQYLTMRATLLGKIQAAAVNLKATPAQMEALVELVPTTFAKVPDRVLAPTERATIRIAKERAGESIALAIDSARHRMKGVIIEHVQAQVLGQREGTAAHLRTRLFDSFGTLNRDFRRIAVTEAGECCNQGFVAASLGRRVRRVEAYRGACEFCRGISGKVFNVVPANAPVKDGQKDVWEGKTNVGRSASPRRRVAGALVERSENERWWPAAGVQHPQCRGSWTPVVDKPAAVSAEFDDWMQKKLAAAIPGYKRPPPMGE
jgi:hypothetical protein